MKSGVCRLLAGVFLALTSILSGHAAGPLLRVPNTTLQMPTNPPSRGFSSSTALGGLGFTNPIVIVSPPDETNRLFVAEKKGLIVVITNLAAPTRTIFMDISSRVVGAPDTIYWDENGLLGLEFHPGYATNGYFYVFYTGLVGGGTNDILSRFQVSSTNANQGDPNTELKLISQFDRDDNHNAGDLHFGSDGYLYVALGDEGGAYGNWANTQTITKNFFSAIMRIDVDNRPGSLPPNPHVSIPSITNYSIPSDNPFVGATNFNGISVNPINVRTEFWAVGMRNPWRFTFDPFNGAMYLGHVGQSTVEWVNLVTKGCNPGWNWFEGDKQWTNSAQIPTNFVLTPPLVEYGHTNGRVCIIGGVVSRGLNLSQLYGSYLYGDHGSGEIWSLKNNGTNVTQNSVIMTDPDTTGAHISAFGVDPSNGDILYAALRNGNNSFIRRIIYNNSTNGAPLPATLAATGAFTNPTTLAVAPGIVPYDLNVPFWSDNAIKTRWFSVPNTNLTITFNRDSYWIFPTGSVWIKHFELQLTNGVPASQKRLETRLLVKNVNGVYGVTYRWGGSTTNATLVGEGGLDESFVIDDGGGILRTQVWHYPSRGECLACHTPAGGYVLGFNTPQMNKDFNYGTTTNQIAALSLAGYYNTNVTSMHTLRALAHPTNSAVSLEYRVRSYLAANCSQCHQPGGTAQALWDARPTTITASAGLVNGPLLDNGGNPSNRVLAPGSIANSMMLTRISTPGLLRMPPLDSNVLDTNGISLLSAWVTNTMPSYLTFADWQLVNFGSTNGPNAPANADPDGDFAKNYLEYLTGTDPLQSTSNWKIAFLKTGGVPRVQFTQMANRGFEVQSTTNLFNSNSWSALDVTGNEPFFSITNLAAQVTDPIANSVPKYYRVRVFEP